MALEDGSTQSGDQPLTQEDVAAKLIERRQPPPVEEAVDEEELTPETNELEGEDQETDEVDTDLEPEEEEQEAEDDDSDADGEPDQGTADAFESIDELAEAAGVELDEFLDSIKVNTKIDGEESSVTLAQLVKGHQLESSFTRKNQAWLEQKKSAEANLESDRAKLTDHFAIATNAFELAQNELMSEYQGIDWARLQIENSQEWAVKRQHFGERQARLNQAKNTSQKQVQDALTRQQAEVAERDERLLTEGHETLLRNIPEWKDEKFREAEAGQIAQYLIKAGYDESEVSTMKDYRLILLARAAMGLKGPSKQKLELAKKKVTTVPRLVKKGVRPRSSGANTEAAKATNLAKKSGKQDDVANALIARGKAREKAARRRSSPR